MIGHAAHGMQTLDGIDVYAGITRSDREDYRLIHGVANFAHRRCCDIVDIGLTAPYVRQSQQLEAETVFAGLRIAFAVTALDEAAQNSKHRRLGQPYCGHDLPEAQRRLRVAEYGEDVEGSTEHPDGIGIIFLHDCFLASLSHGWRPRRAFGGKFGTAFHWVEQPYRGFSLRGRRKPGAPCRPG
jgi:hypothetical protein